MSFHDVVFPEAISYGSSGGPQFNTTIIELANGHEQRNINWAETRAKYDAKFGVKTIDQMEELLDFFNARRGRAYGFLFKDHLDFTIVNQQIGTGNGANKVFQLYKRYEPLTAFFFDRPIRKPKAGTLEMRVNGVIAPHTVSTSTGLVTITTTPPNGATVTVGYCEFYVPVRFDIDHLDPSFDDYDNLSVPSIPLLEIKPR